MEAAISTPLRPVTNIKEYLQDELWSAMLREGMNKADLARKMNVSKPQVTKVFDGDCSIELLIKWLDVLGYQVTMEVK